MIYRKDEAASLQKTVQTVANVNGKTVKRVYFNQTEEEREDEAADGEDKPAKRKVYVSNFIELTTSETDAKAIARQFMQQAIKEHDASEAVNQFSISVAASGISIPYWLPVAKRAHLRESVAAWKSAKKGAYKLDIREYDMTLEVECAKALAMLSELEVYAIKCYNVTSNHLKAVDDNTLSVEEILNYDYTAGYPEKLTFEF